MRLIFSHATHYQTVHPLRRTAGHETTASPVGRPEFFVDFRNFMHAVVVTDMRLFYVRAATRSFQPMKVSAMNRWKSGDILLVGGLEHFLFSHILGIIIPIDFHIFQRGGPTTNQVLLGSLPIFWPDSSRLSL